MNPEEIAQKAEHVSSQLALLSNPNRLMILCRLAEGERSVGALQRDLDLSQSALSQHLAKLRAAGTVVTRREGQTIFYRIGDPDAARLMEALYDVFCAPANAEAEAEAQGRQAP